MLRIFGPGNRRRASGVARAQTPSPSNMSPTPVPSPCNICGGKKFSPFANERFAPSGLPSHCQGCGSLEHHRVVRSVFDGLPRPMLEGSRCLRLTLDRALEPAWFAELTTLAERPSTALREHSDSSCHWLYGSLPSAGAAEDRALLQEMLRVVGAGFLVLVDGALAARYSTDQKNDAAQRARGSRYGDALRALLPEAGLLELVAMDPSSLTLDSVFIVSRDVRRLKQMAGALARHNIHPRVFAGDSLESSAAAEARASARALLPPEFEPAVYRSLHEDVASFSDADLRDHYRRHGEKEGRRAHRLVDHRAFVELVSPELDALELGPSRHRLLRGPRVRHLDLEEGALGDEKEQVDVVLSRHVVESQPDFVGHLQSVQRLLRPGGLYFMLVPDKNYCFDHFNAPSTIAAFLEARRTGRTRQTLRSQITHVAMRTHNEPARHWRGDHGEVTLSRDVIARVVAEHAQPGGGDQSVHAWYFEPESLRRVIAILSELEETDFRMLRLYPTQVDEGEFWVILEAAGVES